MLLGKPSILRSFEYYHLFIFVGLTILVWKISVDSVNTVSWRPRVPTYFQEADLSAGNATLGVSGYCISPLLSSIDQ